MSVVIDASTLVAGLIDRGARGEWARQLIGSKPLLAPHLLPAEFTSGLRRLAAGKVVTPGAARSALAEMSALRVEFYPFEPFAERVWELRDNLTTYDAWYVALAEAHDVPLATLDRRLVEAPGPRCDFRTP